MHKPKKRVFRGIKSIISRETLGENVSGLHYGRCPRDKTLLKKRGSRVFCRRCGWTERRWRLMRRKRLV